MKTDPLWKRANRSGEWRLFLRQVLKPTRVRHTVRNTLIAAALAVSLPAIAYADEDIQKWIPESLTFPDDAEVVMDRAIGSSIRMLSISTGVDVDVLLAEWKDELNETGYPVSRQTGELLDRSIEFSGPGIVNAKIIVTPTSESGRNLIAFDATLN